MVALPTELRGQAESRYVQNFSSRSSSRTLKQGDQAGHVFWWSLDPDLRFSLGQTTTSCRRSVNISIIFSRLASIRENLDEKRCRKLLAMQWHKTLLDESGDEDASKLSRSEIRCCLCFRWLLDASQIQQLPARIFTGLLCFAKIFVYKVTKNLMELISLQGKHGRSCQRALKANDSS